jgi:hypothetical protein
MKKYILLLFVSLFILSCKHNHYENYVITLDSKNINVLSLNIKDSLKLVIRKKKSQDTVILYNESIVISGYVEQANFDGFFLLVKQKPIDSICECNYECYNEKYGHDISFDYCEKAFKKYDKYLYWIILVKTDDVYGPFEKDEYLEMCKKLNVPEDLINQKKKLIYKIFDNINTKP